MTEQHDESPMVTPVDLAASADALLAETLEKTSGRTAHNLIPGAGSPLSQTLLALRGGVELSEHVANGPATLQVLRGAVTVTTRDSLSLGAGQWAPIPRGKHGLTADEDSVVLLTVAPTPGG